jgi:hypothetical protein
MDLQERLTRRFGPGVADWCAGIPALARAQAERWTLELGEPFPAGNSSVAIRCTRSDGSPAVLKLSPDLPVVAEQVETLRLFGAGGRVPAVLAADDGIDARCVSLAAASGLDAGRLYAWCRAVAPIVAITYLRRPGSQEAVAELLALSSE